MYLVVGGVGNGAAEKDGRWDLNLGTAATEGKDHAVLKEEREDHVVLGCSLLLHSLGSRRDFAGKKRGERTLAGGP